MVKMFSIIPLLMMLLLPHESTFSDDISGKAVGILKAPQLKRSFFQMAAKERSVEITISAAGDCTLGYDVDFGYEDSYNDVVSRNGYEYPLKNVADIFKNDDITIVNLETTLTNSTIRAVKEFKFRGEPEYTKILQRGFVEAVNVANNHTYDYLEKGYNDTLLNLQKADIGFFGNDNTYIKDVKGVRIGFLGYTGWSSSRQLKDKISNDIQEMKKQCKVVVVSFHWGIERENYASSTQKDLGRFCIDSGADLVVGHHPHVIQGIETYKGKHIVYSFGNFSYGGHKNPADKDTFIFQQKFMVSGNEILPLESKVIPCLISSTKNYNNYQPTPLSGDEGARVMNRLKTYSSALEYGYEFK